jgi:hypothetical protein
MCRDMTSFLTLKSRIRKRGRIIRLQPVIDDDVIITSTPFTNTTLTSKCICYCYFQSAVSSKLEKADILEMTVQYLERIAVDQRQIQPATTPLFKCSESLQLRSFSHVFGTTREQMLS